VSYRRHRHVSAKPWSRICGFQTDISLRSLFVYNLRHATMALRFGLRSSPIFVMLPRPRSPIIVLSIATPLSFCAISPWSCGHTYRYLAAAVTDEWRVSGGWRRWKFFMDRCELRRCLADFIIPWGLPHTSHLFPTPSFHTYPTPIPLLFLLVFINIPISWLLLLILHSFHTPSFNYKNTKSTLHLAPPLPNTATVHCSIRWTPHSLLSSPITRTFSTTPA
jgi:hypothetical protein